MINSRTDIAGLNNGLNKVRQTTEKALNRIYEGILATDLVYLETHGIDLKLRDFRVLVEIYLLSHQQTITMVDLYDPLLIPIPTLSRIISRLSGEWIVKKVNPKDKREVFLMIKRSKKGLIEGFIQNRIDFYNQVKDWTGPKAFDSILTAFAVALEITQASSRYQNKKHSPKR